MHVRMVAVVLALGAAGCSSVKPVPVAAGESCYRCQRTIENAKLAAELVDANGQARKFRTPGCLATYLKAHPDDAGRVFVTDYSSGELFPVSGALFVRIKMKEGDKIERDFVAFQNIADAKDAAERETSNAVDWAAVRAQAPAPRS